jgi:hypothetical protein
VRDAVDRSAILHLGQASAGRRINMHTEYIEFLDVVAMRRRTGRWYNAQSGPNRCVTDIREEARPWPCITLKLSRGDATKVEDNFLGRAEKDGE